MFGDLWNQAKDKQLLENEKRKHKKLLEQEKIKRGEKIARERLIDRENIRQEYTNKLTKYRSIKGNPKKDTNILRQELLKRKLSKNILYEIEIAKQKGITNILKCPKFIKFIKKDKKNNIINIYIEWELINTIDTQKITIIGITFDYNKLTDTPLKLTNELQNNLIQMKYWLGNDCKEYLYEYLKLNI